MIIYQWRIYRTDLQLNPGVTYVFGDNMARYGLGGQAKEMRGEPNALGIATLWRPGVPFEPTDFLVAMTEWRRGAGLLRDRLEAGETVVFPAEGIGTGFAFMNATLRAALDEVLAEHGFVNDYYGQTGKRPTPPIQGEPT